MLCLMALEAEPLEVIGALLKGAAVTATPHPRHKITFRKWVLKLTTFSSTLNLSVCISRFEKNNFSYL